MFRPLLLAVMFLASAALDGGAAPSMHVGVLPSGGFKSMGGDVLEPSTLARNIMSHNRFQRPPALKGSTSAIQTAQGAATNGGCSLNLYKAHVGYQQSDCKMFQSPERCKAAQSTITWLASYPGSGNTWTRLMLERISGISTGSKYFDPRLYNAGMDGEGKKQPFEVLAVKTHEKPTGQQTSDHALVIVRHPLDAVVSFLNYKLSDGNHDKENSLEDLQKAYAKPEKLGEKGWGEKLLGQWREFVEGWEKNPNAKIVRYEDITADTERVYMQDILPFLGLDTSASTLGERLKCAIQLSSHGSTKRKHSYQFTLPQQQREAAKAIVGEVALRYGYDLGSDPGASSLKKLI